jgi:hypothetical protein
MNRIPAGVYLYSVTPAVVVCPGSDFHYVTLAKADAGVNT